MRDSIFGRKSMVSSSMVPLTVEGSRSAASKAFKEMEGKDVLEAFLQILTARSISSAWTDLRKLFRNFPKSMK